jgi:hypothetical protein
MLSARPLRQRSEQAAHVTEIANGVLARAVRRIPAS